MDKLARPNDQKFPKVPREHVPLDIYGWTGPYDSVQFRTAIILKTKLCGKLNFPVYRCEFINLFNCFWDRRFRTQLFQKTCISRKFHNLMFLLIFFEKMYLEFLYGRDIFVIQSSSNLSKHQKDSVSDSLKLKKCFLKINEQKNRQKLGFC